MVLLLSFQHPDPFKDQKDKDHVKEMVDTVIVELPGTDHKVDVLAHLEDASGDAAQYYANLIGVREGEEESEKTKALVKAILTDDVKQFIEETYNGSVVAIW